MQSGAFTGGQVCFRRFLNQTHKGLVDISNILLPRSTGAGPFIEIPIVEPIGDPGTVLKIKLPQSSTLNVRTTCITAVNGDISEISSGFKSLTSKVSYQSVRLTSPMSLLVSGTTTGANNYSVINIKKGDSWELANIENLVAWSGYDLSVTPKANGLRTSLLCEGTGFMVVNGFHNIFDVTVAENEEILLNPNSVVASNVTLNGLATLGARSTNKLNLKFNIPVSFRSFYAKVFSYGVNNLRFLSASLRKALGVHQSRALLDLRWKEKLEKAQSWLSLTIKSRIFRTAPLYYSVVGPAKILMIDRCQVPNRFNFTKNQIVDHSDL